MWKLHFLILRCNSAAFIENNSAQKRCIQKVALFRPFAESCSYLIPEQPIFFLLCKERVK